jgi:O-antigen/teichoic acid export membrane protein
MREHLKYITTHPLARHFLVYSFGALFIKGISFLLLPLYTRLLTPAEYGVLELLSTFANILDITLSLGLLSVVMIEYYHHSKEERNHMLSKVLSIFLGLSTLLYIGAFAFALVFREHFFPDVRSRMIAIVTLTSYLTFFQSFTVMVMRQEQKALAVTLLQVFSGSLAIGLNVLFVYGWDWKIEGVLWSGLIAISASTFIVAYYLLGSLRLVWRWQTADVKRYLHLGLPFIPNALALWLMSYANRWILLNYTTLDEVGQLSAATKFSALYDPLIIQPFLASYTPMILQRFQSGNSEQPIRRIAILSGLGIFASAFLVQAIAGAMLAAPFQPSLRLIPWLVCANWFSLMAQTSALPLVHQRKVIPLVLSIVAGAIAGVIANFMLVPHFGASGSAMAANVGGIVWLATILLLRTKWHARN